MSVKFWMVLIIIVVALLLFTSAFDGIQQKLNGSLISFTSESHTSSNTEKITETIYNTEYVKPNLCNVLAPYILPSDVQNICVLNGGSWRCDSTFAGCYDLPIGIVDCSLATIHASTYQCQELGGTAICNPTNVYCTY